MVRKEDSQKECHTKQSSPSGKSWQQKGGRRVSLGREFQNSGVMIEKALSEGKGNQIRASEDHSGQVHKRVGGPSGTYSSNHIALKVNTGTLEAQTKAQSLGHIELKAQLSGFQP